MRILLVSASVLVMSIGANAADMSQRRDGTLPTPRVVHKRIVKEVCPTMNHLFQWCNPVSRDGAKSNSRGSTASVGNVSKPDNSNNNVSGGIAPSGGNSIGAQGPKGDTGETGATGPQGPAGPAGPSAPSKPDHGHHGGHKGDKDHDKHDNGKHNRGHDKHGSDHGDRGRDNGHSKHH